MNLSWIFGILLVMGGIGGIITGEIIPGIIALIMAAILLPPVVKLIEQKSDFKLTKIIKVIIIIVGMIVFGTTIETSPSVTKQNNQKVTEVNQQVNNKKQSHAEANEQFNNKKKVETIHAIFDIPALLDKNISYFTSIFGEPVNENHEPTEIAIRTEIKTWTKRFENDGYAIAVTYNIKDGNVTEIFLSKGVYDMPLEKTWITKNEVNNLLKRGNISKNASGYYYRFMWPIQDKGKYTGVEIQKEPFIGANGEQLCNGYPEC